MSDSAETNASEGGLARRTRGKPRKSLLGDTGSSAASSPAPSATAPRSRAKKLNGSLAISALGSESVSSAQTPRDQSPESEEYSTPATSKLPTPAAQDLPGIKTIPSGGAIEVRLPAATRGKSLRNSKYAMTSRRTADEIADSEEDELMSDYSPDAQVARRLQKEEDEKPRPRVFKLSSISSAGRPEAGLIHRDVSAKRGRASTSSLPATERPGKKSKTEDGALDLDAEYARALEYGSDEDSMPNPIPLSPGSDSLDEMSEIQSPLSALTDSEDEPISSRAKVAKSRLAKGQNDTASAVDLTTAGPSAPALANTPVLGDDASDNSTFTSGLSVASMSESPDTSEAEEALQRISQQRRAYRRPGNSRRVMKERDRLENHHPEIKTMWDDLEKMPILKAGRAPQPQTISRQLKPFQLEGLAWMKEMEKTEWRGGLLGDEMGLGKTIQAVSLIMSDYPAKQPSLVLVPPVALMQWQSEIGSYTDGTLKTFVYHGTNQKAKGMTVSQLKKYDVIMMSYNSLESMYRKQEKGFKRKDGIYKERSVIHSTEFHRIILDEAHSIKTRSTTTARACFALKTQYRWCLSGTPLQNRIGEFFSLIRFLNIRPFASYLCKQCPCSTLEWSMDENKRCSDCRHASMQHVSVFNQELLNPIQKFGNLGPGREAFRKLRLMTDRIMLRRLKKDHTNAMELPVKEIYVNRQFFGEEENDFANSIMTSGQRKFDTYVAQGVLLNNYANIFGLIMQMRQVADHPDLILKKNAEGGQNVLVCCICDEPAEDTIRSRCKHDFCRTCVASYVRSTDEPDCPRCHISLAIDLEQPEIEQDESLVKKNSIINRIKMENWTSSSKIELLVHELHKLRSDNASHKSIIFSQFTTMLQLIEWRLRRAGITTVMLDGSMTPAQRQASIEHFMNNIEVECFLVSLKAGGVALNLTEASRVFIVDP